MTMRAIYHHEYKTEQALADAIARLEQVIASGEETYLVDPGLIPAYRDELLYDLANRRDEGELRWISPSSYLVHICNMVWADPESYSILFRNSPFIGKIPKYEKRLTP
jgi:hypothetical protein